MDSRHSVRNETPPVGNAIGPLSIDKVFGFGFISVDNQIAHIWKRWQGHHPEKPLHMDALIAHELQCINRALPDGLSVEGPSATHIIGNRTELPAGWSDRARQQYTHRGLTNSSWEKYMETFTQAYVTAWQAQGNEGYPPHPIIHRGQPRQLNLAQHHQGHRR